MIALPGGQGGGQGQGRGGSGAGSGRGQGGGRRQGGGRGQSTGQQSGIGEERCICLNCGAAAPHRPGQPCREMKCPRCGAMMVRRQRGNDI